MYRRRKSRFPQKKIYHRNRCGFDTESSYGWSMLCGICCLLIVIGAAVLFFVYIAQPCTNDTMCILQNPCTVDYCQNGWCKHDVIDNCCTRDSDCGTAECYKPFCDTISRKCNSMKKANGTGCDDKNSCTVDDKCDNGHCSGKSLTCVVDNQCRSGQCVPGTGCIYENEINGKPCNDNNPCTRDDQCWNGMCAVGVQTNCSHLNTQCKLGACDISDGTCIPLNIRETLECDDGTVCTYSDKCSSGICTGDRDFCFDNNPCTINRCVDGVGCMIQHRDFNNTCIPGCYNHTDCPLEYNCFDGTCIQTYNMEFQNIRMLGYEIEPRHTKQEFIHRITYSELNETALSCLIIIDDVAECKQYREDHYPSYTFYPVYSNPMHPPRCWVGQHPSTGDLGVFFNADASGQGYGQCSPTRKCVCKHISQQPVDVITSKYQTITYESKSNGFCDEWVTNPTECDLHDGLAGDTDLQWYTPGNRTDICGLNGRVEEDRFWAACGNWFTQVDGTFGQPLGMFYYKQFLPDGITPIYEEWCKWRCEQTMHVGCRGIHWYAGQGGVCMLTSGTGYGAIDITYRTKVAANGTILEMPQLGDVVSDNNDHVWKMRLLPTLKIGHSDGPCTEEQDKWNFQSNAIDYCKEIINGLNPLKPAMPGRPIGYYDKMQWTDPPSYSVYWEDPRRDLTMDVNGEVGSSSGNVFPYKNLPPNTCVVLFGESDTSDCQDETPPRPRACEGKWRSLAPKSDGKAYGDSKWSGNPLEDIMCWSNSTLQADNRWQYVKYVNCYCWNTIDDYPDPNSLADDDHYDNYAGDTFLQSPLVTGTLDDYRTHQIKSNHMKFINSDLYPRSCIRTETDIMFNLNSLSTQSCSFGTGSQFCVCKVRTNYSKYRLIQHYVIDGEQFTLGADVRNRVILDENDFVLPVGEFAPLGFGDDIFNLQYTDFGDGMSRSSFSIATADQFLDEFTCQFKFTNREYRFHVKVHDCINISVVPAQNCIDPMHFIYSSVAFSLATCGDWTNHLDIRNFYRSNARLYYKGGEYIGGQPHLLNYNIEDHTRGTVALETNLYNSSHIIAMITDFRICQKNVKHYMGACVDGTNTSECYNMGCYNWGNDPEDNPTQWHADIMIDSQFTSLGLSPSFAAVGCYGTQDYNEIADNKCDLAKCPNNQNTQNSQNWKVMDDGIEFDLYPLSQLTHNAGDSLVFDMRFEYTYCGATGAIDYGGVDTTPSGQHLFSAIGIKMT